MSLRWGANDDVLAGGMSLEGAAAQTDLTRAALDEKAKQERLARIRADRDRKAAALQAQADLKRENIQGLIEAGVESGIQVAGAAGTAAAKKGQTLEGMKGRLTELEGTPVVGETPAVEGDIAKLGEGGGFLGMRGRKREKLTAEAARLKAQIKFREENPEMAAYMQAYGRQG